MKKKKLTKWVILLIVLAIIFACIFVFNKVNLEKLMEENLSEYRTVLFTGESENYRTYIASGYREEPYSFDGVANTLVEFCVITIKPKNGNISSASYTFSVDDCDYVGQFEFNPYDSTMVADTGKKIDDNSNLSLVVSVNGKEEQFTLTNKSSKFLIKPEKAITIAAEFYKDKLTELVSIKSLLAEVFFKISVDSNFLFENNYYYIKICTRENVSFACVIDVMTGNIMSTSG